jgi:hypothetical protein
MVMRKMKPKKKVKKRVSKKKARMNKKNRSKRLSNSKMRGLKWRLNLSISSTQSRSLEDCSDSLKCSLVSQLFHHIPYLWSRE